MNTMQTPSTSSAFLQPRYVEQRKNVTKKRLPFEDNVGLSEEEEDIMLAQCIRSGMPKVSCSCIQYVASRMLKNTLKKNTFLFHKLGIYSTQYISYYFYRIDSASLIYFSHMYDDFYRHLVPRLRQ